MKNKNFGRKRQAIYILSNRKSTRIIKTLMDFFFFIKVKIKMVCFSVPSYGHAVGDIVLQKFGKLLKGTFREGDILGRIGGDEFGVIMKNIQTKDIAMKKAEELLAKTQAYKIDELKGNNISISIGISTAPQDGDCYMDLYKRADQALYQAKRSGKARVCNYFS